MLDAFRRRTALLFVLSIATGCESLVPADADFLSTFGRGDSPNSASSQRSEPGWTTTPAEGACSMVSYNNRYWREMAAEQNLVQVEREL
jgi:hypothetical protein